MLKLLLLFLDYIKLIHCLITLESSWEIEFLKCDRFITFSLWSYIWRILWLDIKFSTHIFFPLEYLKNMTPLFFSIKCCWNLIPIWFSLLCSWLGFMFNFFIMVTSHNFFCLSCLNELHFPRGLCPHIRPFIPWDLQWRDKPQNIWLWKSMGLMSRRPKNSRELRFQSERLTCRLTLRPSTKAAVWKLPRPWGRFTC